jgi:uncharacterized protein (DUF58 family)
VESLVRQMWRFRITRGGKLLLLALGMTLVTGTVALTLPVYHLFCAILALAVIPLLGGLLAWPRLSLETHLPDRAASGREMEIEISLQNRSRLGALEVSAGFFDLPPSIELIEPASTIPILRKHETARLRITLLPKRRGVYRLAGLRPFTSFPFNLFRTGPWAQQAHWLTVVPRYHPIERIDLPVGSRYQPGGVALTSNIGESPEYIGSRPYRPGDSPRRLDARAWARLTAPAVKEYQEEYYCRVGLILDTKVRRWMFTPVMPEFEGAISLLAATAEALSRGEYLIDVFAAGPELYVFRAGRHIAHFDNVMEILACLSPSRRNPLEVLTPALMDELQNISTAVFVLLDWDEHRRCLVRAAVESGCATRVLIVRDTETTDPPGPDEEWAGGIRQFTPDQVRQGQVEAL